MFHVKQKVEFSYKHIVSRETLAILSLLLLTENYVNSTVNVGASKEEMALNSVGGHFGQNRGIQSRTANYSSVGGSNKAVDAQKPHKLTYKEYEKRVKRYHELQRHTEEFRKKAHDDARDAKDMFKMGLYAPMIGGELGLVTGFIIDILLLPFSVPFWTATGYGLFIGLGLFGLIFTLPCLPISAYAGTNSLINKFKAKRAWKKAEDFYSRNISGQDVDYGTDSL